MAAMRWAADCEGIALCTWDEVRRMTETRARRRHGEKDPVCIGWAQGTAGTWESGKGTFVHALILIQEDFCARSTVYQYRVLRTRVPGFLQYLVFMRSILNFCRCFEICLVRYAGGIVAASHQIFEKVNQSQSNCF